MEEMLSINCLIPRELNYFLKSLLLRTQAIRKTKKHLLTEDGESDVRGYSHILATVCAVGYTCTWWGIIFALVAIVFPV